MTHLVEVRSTSEKYLFVDEKNFRENISDESGAVWRCYIFQMYLKKDVEMLEKSTIELFREDEILS